VQVRENARAWRKFSQRARVLDLTFERCDGESPISIRNDKCMTLGGKL
jgi:hypothetical protein